MKILVTGAAGFVGSSLSSLLLARGDTVCGLDNLNDYYDPARKRANLKRLSSSPGFAFVEMDIRARDALFKLFKERKIDVVAHLAAMAGVRNAVEHPALYVEVDLNGTQHLMDAALANGVKRVVFSSTSSVYGATKQLPFVESDPCDRPLQPYAAAKRAAEMLGHTYHHLYGLQFTALRLFTVYGPHNRPDMMAFKLAESVCTGVEVPLYAGGRGMYRDWTFVEDIAAGLVAAIDKPLGFEIMNLGRGEPVPLLDFISLLEEISGGKAKLREVEKPAADVEGTFADISKARRLLGYNPKTSVGEGVRRFWEWYGSQ